MARSKFSPAAIVVEHYMTLRDFDTGKRSAGDYAVYLGLPILAVATGLALGAQARNVPQILSAVAILTGLIFGLFTLVFTLAARAVDADDHGLRDELIELSDELRANVSYAVLLGIVLTSVLGAVVMFSDTNRPAPHSLTAVMIFLALQLMLTIFMVLKRIRALHQGLRRNQPEPIP